MKALTAMVTTFGMPTSGNKDFWEQNFAREIISTIAAAPQFVLR